VISTVPGGSSTTSPGKTSSPSTGGLADPTGSSSTNTKGGTNVGAIVGGTYGSEPRFRMKTGSDHALTGVVGSVVPLTILAVVLFLYSRHRRQQQSAPQQIQNQDQNQDQYQQHPPSMYGPPLVSPSFTPYVSLP